MVLGIAVPPLGEILQPYIGGAVFALLVVSFLRVDPAALVRHLRRPGLVLGVVFWTSIAIPILSGGAAVSAGIDTAWPNLFAGIVLQSASAPMMAAPAIAALLGLDATLILLALVGSSVLVPLSAPILAHLFVGDALTISPSHLGWKLFGLLASSAIVGLGLRRLFGVDRIDRHKAEIDGGNVIGLFLFAAALMVDVASTLLETPLLWFGLLATGVLAFVFFFSLSLLMFWRCGSDVALAVAFMTAQRNVGLMLAAAGGVLSDLTWLYFALSQIPVYLSPRILEPIVTRIRMTKR
jgi:BASS family bile acid:Na+ symporter